MIASTLDALTVRNDPISSPPLQATEAQLNRLFPRRDIRKVLLVNPPDVHASMFQYEAARRRRYADYPPYGLAVLAQQLRSVGVEVRILNLHHEILAHAIESLTEAEFAFDAVWQTGLDAEIADFRPDLVGVTCMFTMTHTSFRDVCVRVSQWEIPLAMGGVHVTNDVERVLDDIPQAALAFLREGDVAVKKFVQVVNRERAADELGQLIINDGGTRYRYLSECLPSSEDVSIIPAYDLLDISNYSRYGTIGSFHHLRPEGTRFATVISNRGCRAQCTFCSVATFNGRNVRQRAIPSVIDELALLQDEYGIGHFMWLDDDLLKDHKRAISLFNEMVKRPLKLTWDATNGVIAASCKDEVIAAAAESGCIGLHIGMESGNPKILREIKKPGTVRNFLEAAEVFRRHEQIFASVFVMIGFPGETLSMIRDTINVARQMDLDWYSIGQLQPLPNTPIYDAMVAQGIIPDVGGKGARFTLGHHGKADEREKSKVPSSMMDIAAIPGDAIPVEEQLIDIWFYMDYYLNYDRLFTEERPVKIRQQLAQLTKVSDILYPDHGFALYFLGYLQHKVHGKIDPRIVERLNKQLSASSYWQCRFEAFGLSAEDLTSGRFKSRARSSGQAEESRPWLS